MATKAVDATQLDGDLTSVANAVRQKGGTSAALSFPAGFVSAVQAIPTGITPSGTKNITTNGTYDVTNFASAAVNVQGGGGVPSPITAGNFPVLINPATVVGESYNALAPTGITLTIPRAGTYRFRWMASHSVQTTPAGSQTSVYTQLYKNGTAVGSPTATVNHDADICSADVTCNAGDTVEIWMQAVNVNAVVMRLSSGACGLLTACINWNPWN